MGSLGWGHSPEYSERPSGFFSISCRMAANKFCCDDADVGERSGMDRIMASSSIGRGERGSYVLLAVARELLRLGVHEVLVVILVVEIAVLLHELASSAPHRQMNELID